MFHLHGRYRWFPRRIAFRNDFCLTCQRPVRAVCIRTFDVHHLWWIPVVPLGFWSRWQCTACGRQPHHSPRTRYAYKVAGLVVLVLFSIGAWVAPIEPGAETAIWIFRIACPLAAVATALHLSSAKREPAYREQFQAVDAAQDETCPFCGTELLPAPFWECPTCGVRRT